MKEEGEREKEALATIILITCSWLVNAVHIRFSATNLSPAFNPASSAALHHHRSYVVGLCSSSALFPVVKSTIISVRDVRRAIAIDVCVYIVYAKKGADQ